MKPLNFDGHKLMYHPGRVNEFLTSGDCFPLYMEISPVGSCNHRCVFCAYDYIGYPNRKLETVRTLSLLDEMAECGLKSVLFAGEGEPLLHPDIASLARQAHSNGIDCGMFSNGHLLKKELAEELLPALTFIRFSFNGGSRENYAAMHTVKPEAFDLVVANIAQAVEIRNNKALKVDIGAQFVLLPENVDYLISATETLKRCGIDYLAIKPFMQRESQSYQMSEAFALSPPTDLLLEAEALSTETFRVTARTQSFEDNGVRHYDRCYGTSFITVLNSAGVLSSCLPYWEREEFSFGSIYEHSFRELWSSPKRAAIKEQLEKRLDAHSCPPSCRANAINQYLWDLQQGRVKHVNFI